MNVGADPASALLPAAAATVVGWWIVSRVRHLVVRQPVRPRWHRATVLVALVGIAGAVVAKRTQPPLLEGLAVGVALGAFGAWLALRLTRFEVTDDGLCEGLYFTPNATIGTVVSVVFVGRILFEGWQLVTGGPPRAMSPPNPLTISTFGLVAGYFACYPAGILRWKRHRRRATRASPGGRHSMPPS